MSDAVPFAKMHGLGNDYIYFECLKEPRSFSRSQIQTLCNRHFGIGADGVVLILPSKLHDFRMRMFNADGSEAEMCGNAVRCVAKYLYEKGFTAQRKIVLETKAGPKTLELRIQGGRVESVRVDMGEPLLDPARIPVLSSKSAIISEPFEDLGQTLNFTCVSMGNPHAIFIVPEITDHLVLELGPKIEKHPIFPAGTNVEFIKVLGRSKIEMRVWERGSGETLACGTGACASAVACVLNKLTERNLRVLLPGGVLEVEWAADNHVYQTGPAALVFEGRTLLDEQ
ncbi:MAG: diaminopimelate epimerase [Deltaproteobacteria bacterium]|nr:diaminopimelate epimerase [Deltaproteobacteria bacterium]